MVWTSKWGEKSVPKTSTLSKVRPSASEVDSDSSSGEDSRDDSSSDTSSSEDSSGSEPPASEVSDQYSMLEHAYDAAKNAFHVDQDDTLQGGNATLNLMEIFPPHWPFAKMTLPLKFCVQRLDRLIAGHLMEVIATHQDPEQCRKSTSAFAKTLTVRLPHIWRSLLLLCFDQCCTART